MRRETDMLVKELMPPAPDELIIYINGEFLPDSRAGKIGRAHV